MPVRRLKVGGSVGEGACQQADCIILLPALLFPLFWGDLCLFMYHYFGHRHVWMLLFGFFNGLSQRLAQGNPAVGDREEV